MSMPNEWVERLFTRLLARYGSAWIAKWAGVDDKAVQDDWCRVLGAMPASRLVYGLDNLPDRPPNATEFRALCLQHPEERPIALPWPKADPAMVATVLAGIKPPPTRDMKQWARDLRVREEAGDRLTFAQRTMWRAALASEAHATASADE